MNWIVLKSKRHRWQSHHLEATPKSRANSTDAMKNAKRNTFFFFPHVTESWERSLPDCNIEAFGHKLLEFSGGYPVQETIYFRR